MENKNIVKEATAEEVLSALEQVTDQFDEALQQLAKGQDESDE